MNHTRAKIADDRTPFTSAADVGRALFANLDERVANLAARLAERRALCVRRQTSGVIVMTKPQIAELAGEYSDALFAAVFSGESERIAAIINSAGGEL